MGISTQLESNTKQIARLAPPFQGVWKTLPPHLLPPDTLADASNVALYRGKLVPRSGLAQLSSFTFNSPILSSYLYVNSANHKTPIAISSNRLYAFAEGWTDQTATAKFATPEGFKPRVTQLMSGNINYLLICNGTESLYYFNGGNLTPVVITSGNSPGKVTDITTAFGRVVMLIPPYTLAWSETYQPFALPALNTAILSDTEDSLVAIKNLGTLGFAVYKEASVITALAQGGSSATAFRFDFRGDFEGPCSPSAVISVQGVHYGFTLSGRIFRFDGTTFDYIADGIRPFLQDTFDKAYKHLVHGCYDLKTHRITFFYPRIGDNGTVKGLMSLCLPSPLAGIKTFSAFPGILPFSCTDSLSSKVYANDLRAFVFGDNRSFALDKDTIYDDHNEIPISFQTGFFSSVGDGNTQGLGIGKIFRPTYEVYLNRLGIRKTVNFQAVLSNNLEQDSGTLSEVETLDLTVSRPNEYISFGESASFVGFKLSGLASSQIAYLGCDIYARETT